MVGLRLLDDAGAGAVVPAVVAGATAVAVGVDDGVAVGVGMARGVSAAFWASVSVAKVTEQPLAG
jgi:hypothetical protein